MSTRGVTGLQTLADPRCTVDTIDSEADIAFNRERGSASVCDPHGVFHIYRPPSNPVAINPQYVLEDDGTCTEREFVAGPTRRVVGEEVSPDDLPLLELVSR